MALDPTIIAGMPGQTVIAGGPPGAGMPPPTPPMPPRRIEEEEDSPLSRPAKPRERMEFALPTINVIFLLMLYFLIAGTIVQNDELSVTPPVTTEAPTDRLPRPLLVVNEAGGLLLNGEPLTREELMVAAAEAVMRSQEQTLNVLAPAAMAAGPFLELINAFAASNIPVRVVMIDKASLDTPSSRAAAAAAAEAAGE